MNGNCLAIILAAGEGKRMKSDVPKVLHPVAGQPMLLHVLDQVKKAGILQSAVVVGNQAEMVSEIVSSAKQKTSVFEQKERLGTAHAVLAAREAVSDSIDKVIVLYGDVPLISTDTISRAIDSLDDGADLMVLGFKTDDPSGYGRMIERTNDLVAIREHKDASDEEKKINYCNSGIMVFRGQYMLNILDSIGNQNSQGEFYLTDAVEIGLGMGLSVKSLEVDEEETLGVNDRIQLADVESRWQNRRRSELLSSGVSMAAPHTVHFAFDTEIDADVTIEPNVVFAKGVVVSAGAVIRSFSHLEEAHVGPNAVVGPYARLRPGTKLGAGVKVGNFVEVKSTNVQAGAKINHLSYIGDADVGEKSNIGAGTITCNYDGYGKHKTQIGAEAFIGSNTSLVAPVTIGARANTGAGSIITQDVPDDALALERSDQANLEGKAKSLRARNLARKEKK